MNTDIIFEMEIRAKAFCFCYGMEAGDLRGYYIRRPGRFILQKRG
jgi:hypothetical protein